MRSYPAFRHLSLCIERCQSLFPTCHVNLHFVPFSTPLLLLTLVDCCVCYVEDLEHAGFLMDGELLRSGGAPGASRNIVFACNWFARRLPAGPSSRVSVVGEGSGLSLNVMPSGPATSWPRLSLCITKLCSLPYHPMCRVGLGASGGAPTPACGRTAGASCARNSAASAFSSCLGLSSAASVAAFRTCVLGFSCSSSTIFCLLRAGSCDKSALEVGP